MEIPGQFSVEINTPAMQERGRLVRKDVKLAVEALRPALSVRLGTFGDDFLVEASDGIGRKTELPWVRFCSAKMSPAATEGFYCGVHFSTDGSAVHVTIGCASSRFNKGSSIPLSNEELDRQTEWARKVLLESTTLQPFVDPAKFGATRPLPLSFERAIAVSKRIAYEDIDNTDFEELFGLAVDRLKVIYEAQAVGRDISPADQVELEAAALTNPRRSLGRRQGYGLPPEARRAVEMRAMQVAEAWLRTEGYAVKDCSALHPFDFEAARGGQVLKIEVKGTTSDWADAVLMTKNEVDLHRTEKGATALILVSKIQLSKHGTDYVANGGHIEVLIGWDILEWEIEPTAFRISRRAESA